MEYFKLTRDELEKLVKSGLLKEEEAKAIISMSMARQPEKFSKGQTIIPLTKTIFISNIHFYGGEHFNDPYYFVAEIYHKTTESAFSKWWNRNVSKFAKRRSFNY